MNPTILRYNEAKAERTELSLRIGEIDQALALGRAEYLLGKGGGNPAHERAELAAERATLNLRRMRLNVVVDGLRDEAKEARARTLVHLLCEALEQRGMKDVIEDCRRRASDTDPMVD